MLLGLGRICVDEYYLVSRLSTRFDSSQKLRASRLTRDIGGSIPHILATAAALGVESVFVGKLARDDAQSLRGRLERLDVDLRLSDVDRSSVSHLYIEPGDVCRLIVSIDDDPGSELDAEDVLTAVADIHGSIAAIVLDARQSRAAQVVCSAFASSDASALKPLIILDPGSTPVRGVLEPLFVLADLVIVGVDTLRALGGDAEEAARSLAAVGTSVVLTHEDGSCSAFAPHYDFLLESLQTERVGSSIGAGDAFRGALIASLLLAPPPYDLSQPRLETAVKAGMAAAAWRLADPELLPSEPTWNELSAWMRG